MATYNGGTAGRNNAGRGAGKGAGRPGGPMVAPVEGATRRAAAAGGLAPLGRAAAAAVFEPLEHRTLMAGQPAATDSSMAYDAAGNLHVAYHDAATHSLKYTRQSPAGTWTSPVTVDAATADTGRMVSLAVDAAGRVGVAYYDATSADLRFASLAGSTWTPVTVDAKGAVGQNPSLAFDAKNVPVISYYRPETGDLRLATLKNAKKNAWTITTIAKKGDVGQFSSVAIDPATNKPTVAFTGADGTVQYAAKKNGSYAKPVVIDHLAGAAGAVDVAFGPGGKPVVSYFDPATGAIKLAEPAGPKGKTFDHDTVATVPAGSNPTPTLVVNPTTGAKQVVYFDAATNGVFVAAQAAGGTGVQTTQLKSGGGEGFIAAVQPGNGSISYAVIDTETPAGGGSSSGGPVELGNTETTPVAPSGVAVAATGPTTVDVAWADNAANETGFVVERSVDGTAFAVVAQLPPNASSYTDATALEGTTYQYRVGATGAGGTAVYGTLVGTPAGAAATPANTRAVVTTPPAAPTNLVAGTPTPDLVTLTWVDHSATNTAYEVQRTSAGTGLWQLIGVTGPDVGSYADASVTENTGYSYRVYARQGLQTSLLSNVAAATTAPAAPTDLAVSAVTTGSVTLAWVNHSPRATSLVLERGTTFGSYAPLTTLPATATAYTDTTVAEGQSYYYRVKSVGLVDGNSYSNSANATTAPLAPSNLAAAATSPSDVTLTWTDNADSETGYLVQRSTAGGPFLTVATLAANTTTWTDAGRAEGVVYAYKVRAALAGAPDSGFSGTVSTVTLPSAPTEPGVALAAGGTQVALNWTDNSAGESGYQVQRQAAGAVGWTTIATTAANATTYVDATAAEGTAYAYRVRAVNAAGTSAFAGPVSATTVPAAPVGLTVSAASETELALAWTDRSGGETGYVVERSTDGGDTFAPVATVGADVTAYADAGLEPATEYAYRVRATNAGGNSAATFAVAGTTLAAAPTGLTADAASTTLIDLSWDAVDGADSYVVERRPAGGEWAQLDEVDGPAYGDAVAEAAAYEYRVRSVNAGGTGAASDPATGASLPAAPTAAAAAVNAFDSVTLTWVDHSAGETGFAIARSVDGGEFLPLDTVAANVATYTDPTTGEATGYAYRVVATGLGGASAAATADAVVTPLLAPTGLAASTNSAVSIHLVWTDASSAEDGYVVERQADGGAWAPVGTPTAADAEAYDDTTAVAGVGYAYRVTAFKGEVSSSAAGPVAGETLAAAPTGVTATADSAAQVTVNWAGGAGSDGFVVERTVGAGDDWAEVGTISDPETTTYVDTLGLAESTQYVYRVRGTNGSGTGPASEATTVYTQPAAPTDLVAAGNGPTEIDLTWADHSATGAAAVHVFRALGDGAFAEIDVLAPGTESYADTGVSGGTTYRYEVATDDGTSASLDSNIVVATTVPEAVADLAPTSADTGSVSLTWAASTGATSYLVERDDGDGFATLGTPATPGYVDADVIEGATYTYRVSPVGTAGPGPAATAAGTVLPAGATDLTVTAHTDSSVTLSWTDNSGGETGYEVSRSDDDGDTWTPLTPTPSNVETYTDAGAAEAKTYVYQVTAVNAGGHGVAATVGTTTLPAAPTGLTATAAGATTVNLAWEDHSAGEAEVEVQRFDAGAWATLQVLPANAVSYADSVPAGSTNRYRVRMTNAGGSSAFTLEASATTVPGQVTGVTAAATTNSVTLSWSAVAGATGYRVYRSDDGGDTFAQVGSDLGAGAVGYTDLTAAEATAYVYEVAAFNATGAGAASADQVVATPPLAPDGLGVTAVGPAGLTLTWADRSAGEDGFEVERSADNGGTWEDLGDNAPAADAASVPATGGTGSYADAGLAEATGYAYRVRATFGAERSDWSATFAADTSPVAPASLTVTGFTDESVSLAWADSSAGEDAYEVERSDDNGGSWTSVDDALAAGTTTYTDAGLGQSADYVYRVRAVKGTSPSAYGPTATVTTRPAAPSDLVATATGPTTVDLTWVDHATAEDGFTIERSTDGGDTWDFLATASANATTYTDAAAPESATTQYRIRAAQGAVESADGDAATATTPVASPADLAATATSATGVHLTWTPASTVATAQRVERSVDGGGTWVTAGTVLNGTDAAFDDAGLTEDTTYDYRVVAVAGSAESDPGTGGTATTQLLAPTGLAAASPTAASVHLTWANASAAATDVVIERNDGNGWSTFDTVAGTATDYTDGTVAEGVAYAYRIHAAKTGNASAVEGPANVTTLPAAPTAFAATAFSQTQIDLAWADNSGHETGYRVERAADGGAFAELTTTLPGATGFSDLTAYEGGTFAYLVYALGAGGESAQGPASASTAPATPTDLAAVATEGQVALTWTDASTHEAGYEVERSDDNGGSWATLDDTLPAGTAAYADTTVAEGVTYQYRVRALTAAVEGDPTAAETATAPLVAPTNVVGTAVSATQVDVAWEDHSGAETSYEVDRSDDNGATWGLLTTVGANATSHSDSTAAPGVTYVYRVRATDGVLTATSVASAPVGTVPTDPTTLVATAASDTQVGLTWADADGEAGYTVERSDDAGGTWSELAAGLAPNTTAYTDGTATENGTYLYQVKATNPAGSSGYATSASVTTLPTGPDALVATATTADTVELIWDDHSNAEAGFKIERRPGGGVWAELTTVGPDVEAYSDAGLPESTTYEYRVSATVGGRDSAASNTQVATTKPVDLTGLAVSGTTDTSVTLTWTNPSAAPMVVVERSTDGGVTFTMYDTVGQGVATYTDTGLAEGTTYHYQVRAYNGDGGFGGYSNAVPATTLAAAPGTTAATFIDPADVQVSWVDRSAVETGYVVQRRPAGGTDNDWADVAPLPAGSTLYYDGNGVDDSNSYDYRVGAVTGDGTMFGDVATAVAVI